MSASAGVTIFVDIIGASIGSIDNVIQTINAGTTVETTAGLMNVVAALTGPIPGVGILTNSVALTMTAITADADGNGVTLGSYLSAAGSVVGVVSSAFALAGVSVPLITIAAISLTVAGIGYTFYDLYQKGVAAGVNNNLAASNPKCNTLPQVRCPDANQNFVPTASAG
jgi:hypothetical protein